MSARNHTWEPLLVLGLLCTAACASVGGVPTTTPRKFARVNVSVDGWAVEAVLIDRSGRRTGWTRDARHLDEINGCRSQSGWEDDTQDPRPDATDTAGVAVWEEERLQDSIYFASDPPPTWHFFEIGDDMNFRAGGPQGLIDQGGCELRLDPIHAGALRLAINAEGSGFRACEDTTSTLVTPGKPQRWRLSWKAAGDSCIVKMARVDVQRSTK